MHGVTQYGFGIPNGNFGNVVDLIHDMIEDSMLFDTYCNVQHNSTLTAFVISRYNARIHLFFFQTGMHHAFHKLLALRSKIKFHIRSPNVDCIVQLVPLDEL